MEALLVSAGLVFVAELGDKSQLMALALATRYRALPVLAGVAAAAIVMLGLSALVGGLVGAALPTRWVALGAGVLFLVFGVLALRGDDHDHGEARERSGSALLATFVAFLVAEFGDKTMLATAALASQRAPGWVWVGAALGMTAASGLAILVGRLLGKRLPAHVLRYVSAGAFLLFGGLLLIDAITG